MNNRADLINPKQVARRLGIALQTVYKWARSGYLPCVPMGGSIRFRPESIEKFIDERERTAYGKVA